MENKEEIICFHCGDICKDDSISKDGKYFCCSGCLYVHELLSDNNLNDFLTFKQIITSNCGVNGFKPLVNKLSETDLQHLHAFLRLGFWG